MSDSKKQDDLATPQDSHATSEPELKPEDSHATGGKPTAQPLDSHATSEPELKPQDSHATSEPAN